MNLNKPNLLLTDRYHRDSYDLRNTGERYNWGYGHVNDYIGTSATYRKNDGAVLSNYYAIGNWAKEYDKFAFYGSISGEKYFTSKISPVKIDFQHLDLSYLVNLPEFTKRNIKLIKTSNILIHYFSYPQFVKAARYKYFEPFISEPWNPDNTAKEYVFGTKGYIYISDIVEFNLELRAFVLDDQILTSSLYKTPFFNDTGDDEKNKKGFNFDNHIDNTPLKEYVRGIRSKFPNLPRGIVMDFGQLTSGDWALIEFNEAWCSSLYYCDPKKCLEVILASQGLVL